MNACKLAERFATENRPQEEGKEGRGQTVHESRPSVTDKLGDSAVIEFRDERWIAIVEYNGLISTVGSYRTAQRGEIEAKNALERLQRWECPRSFKAPAPTPVTPRK